MRRGPSLLVRSTRLVIGLITLWCLGCSSYEPLLASLLGDDAPAMRCDADESMAAASDRVDQSSGGNALGAVSASATDRGFDCGCGGSCHAPSPPLGAVTAATPRVVSLVRSEPHALVSVARTPIPRPPERTL